MNHGKHYVDSAKLIDRTKTYEPQEALELCCKTAKAKFDETVELHVRLGVDSRHADQQVRGAVVLPNGTGKNVRVVAICKGDAAKAAEAAGAQEVGDDDLIAKIQGGYLDFDVLVTTPDMMGRVGRLGKILGPRGLMPNPKAGTVTPDVGKAVTDAKAGKIEYRLDKQNIIHVPVGCCQGPVLQERNHRHHHGSRRSRCHQQVWCIREFSLKKCLTNAHSRAIIIKLFLRQQAPFGA